MPQGIGAGRLGPQADAYRTLGGARGPKALRGLPGALAVGALVLVVVARCQLSCVISASREHEGPP